MTKSELAPILTEAIADCDRVEERAGCNPHSALQSLRGRLAGYLRRFKELDAQTREDVEIMLDASVETRIVIARVEFGRSSFVTFSVAAGKIEARTIDGSFFHVTPVWDLASRTTKFEVGDEQEQLTAPQLSERFLAPLFFPRCVNPPV